MDRLKGENQIERFRHVAERLASKISSYEGVTGIVFIGGLVRGFVDKFSDLDIIVFINRKDEQLKKRVHGVGLEDEGKHSRIDIDLEIHFLEDFKRWRWDEVDKWEFSHAEIVFDSEGDVKNLFREKLRLPKNFWIRRIAICAEYLKWYSCPPKEDVGTVAEAWIERGDIVAAHYCLNYAVELLVRMIFALNKEFLPAPKWRMFYSYSLKWLPKDYRKLIGGAMCVGSFSKKDFNRRLKVLRELWREIVLKIKDETGLTTMQLSEYFVEKVLHQTWIHSTL